MFYKQICILMSKYNIYIYFISYRKLASQTQSDPVYSMGHFTL